MHGVTSGMSWVLFSAVFLISFFRSKPIEFFKLPSHGIEKYFWIIGFMLALGMMGIIGIASLKPIHLPQEFDCMNYHYTLPRQHLILGSFSHIPWSADVLFLLPMDFDLEPFWFSSLITYFIPQLFFFLGLVAVTLRLTSVLAGRSRAWAGPLVVLVILGTHGFCIQMGTGMLDLAVAYLFLASLDSLQQGKWLLAGIEFTFFFWSKPLMPMGMIVMLSIWGLLLVLVRRSNWQIKKTVVLKNWPATLVMFIFLSFFVGGPFVVKSIHDAGTPFYPLKPGMMGTNPQIMAHPQIWDGLQKASHLWMVNNKNSYGHGRGLIAFLKHWWLLAVPENGVNNAFDYPLGLTYLLLIGPFVFFLIKDIRRQQCCPLSLLAVIAWMLWWFTDQQSRFLYLPLMVIFVVTIARLDKIPKGIFLGILIGLILEIISLWGAHRADFTKWDVNDLRPEDQQLLGLNHRYLDGHLSGYLDWPTHDVAFAQFPVMVHKENLPHTILF